MLIIERNYDLRRLYKSLDAAVKALTKQYPQIITEELYFYFNEVKNDLIMALNYVYSIDLNGEVNDFANLRKLARHSIISLFEGVYEAEIADEDSFFQNLTFEEKVTAVLETTHFEGMGELFTLVKKTELFADVTPYTKEWMSVRRKQDILRTLLTSIGNALYILYKEILDFYNDSDTPIIHCEGCVVAIDAADYLWTACEHCIRKEKRAYDDALNETFLTEVRERNFSICMD